MFEDTIPTRDFQWKVLKLDIFSIFGHVHWKISNK